MRLFALVERSLPEPLELYAQREDAERTLAEVVCDEHGWESLLAIEEIELGEPVRN